MSTSSLEYLRHIRDEADFLAGIASGLDCDAFLSDEVLKRAVVRSLEVVGEATRKVPEDVRRRYPAVEWRKMAGMRNRLIHDYFGVDYYLVFDVLKNKVPALRDEIGRIIEAEESGARRSSG
jgi:uncharacterized protein with HEPN domain